MKLPTVGVRFCEFDVEKFEQNRTKDQYGFSAGITKVNKSIP